MTNEPKQGVVIEVPSNRRIHVRRFITDYTGTLSFAGKLNVGTVDRLSRLRQLVDVMVLTSDSFGTATRELASAGIVPVILRQEDGPADEQKIRKAATFDLHEVAAFGNGRNDRLLLRGVRDAGGFAVAVDNGEGCAVETLQNAEIFVCGASNALDLLLDKTRAKATLRN